MPTSNTPSHRLEYGLVYINDAGDIHTEWGFGVQPALDRDGEFQIGNGCWVKVYEIVSRPALDPTSVWVSDDCPWKESVT